MTLTEQVRHLITQQQDTPVCLETALTLLAEAVDALNQELADHLKDCPHVKPPIPLGRLEELREDRERVSWR